jgi:hypothetical protein
MNNIPRLGISPSEVIHSKANAVLLKYSKHITPITIPLACELVLSESIFSKDVWYFFANPGGRLGSLFIKAIGNIWIAPGSFAGIGSAYPSISTTPLGSGTPPESMPYGVVVIDGASEHLMAGRNDIFLGFRMSSAGVGKVSQELAETLDKMVSFNPITEPNSSPIPEWLDTLSSEMKRVHLDYLEQIVEESQQ